jgi:hypothetical protein
MSIHPKSIIGKKGKMYRRNMKNKGNLFRDMWKLHFHKLVEMEYKQWETNFSLLIINFQETISKQTLNWILPIGNLKLFPRYLMVIILVKGIIIDFCTKGNFKSFQNKPGMRKSSYLRCIIL